MRISRLGRPGRLFAMISIFLLHAICGQAKSNAAAQPHSKDYKSFPSNTPEAALTAFIEADLGDFYNRQNDNRYPLWWGLTERGGIPEDGYLKLFIESYKIADRAVNKRTGDVTLFLEMDVRAVWASGDPVHSESNWNDIAVSVDGADYRLRSKQFVETVFGHNSESILNKVVSDYPTLKSKRIWRFPVRLTYKNGAWLIAMDSIPPNASYVKTMLSIYSEQIDRQLSMNETCKGKRKVDRRLMEPFLDYVQSRVGTSLKRFQKEFCSQQQMEARDNEIREIVKASKQFKDMTMD